MQAGEIHAQDRRTSSFNIRGPMQSIRFAGLAAMIALWCCASPQFARAQTATNHGDLAPHVVLSKLSPPVYSQLARLGGLAGNVILKVSVRPDGSIESVTAVSGNPVLMQAALESAQHSQFECRACDAATGSQSLTYSFRISEEKPDPCCCTGDQVRDYTPKVSQSEDHITITAPIGCICPDSCTEAWARARSRFRSPKCLYFWKCGHRRISIM